MAVTDRPWSIDDVAAYVPAGSTIPPAPTEHHYTDLVVWRLINSVTNWTEAGRSPALTFSSVSTRATPAASIG